MSSLLGNQSFRDYQIKEVIGTGGFGVVYLAHQPVINRDVAIKAILPEYANEPEFVRRFEREAQFIARLEHLHIVPIYDYWRDPHGAYIVMRMFKGGNLAQSLYYNGPPELPLVARLVDQVASALYAAHQEGIIHQDIKPENILLDEESNGYLTDFGIAKNLFDDSGQDKKRYGSPAYTSPENMTGGVITPQSDIYSFGVLAYSMLAGLPKSTTGSDSKVTKQLKAVERRPLFEVRPDLPEDVGDVIYRATHENAHLRHPDAYSFAVDFRTALQLPESDLIRPSPQRPPTIDTSEDIDIGQDTFAFETGTGTILFDTGTQTVNLPTIINPYKGLRPFEEADSAQFYGRDKLVKQLIARLGSEDSDHFLAVVGASGSGKSSVVKAGMIPLLRLEALPQSDRWFISTMVPGPQPFKELEQALLRVAVGMPEGELADYFRAGDDGLHKIVGEILPGDDANLFLFIDQFEEIFLQASDEDRRHFLDNLVYALTIENSHFWLVVTLRADFYDRPLSVPNFGELMQKHTEVVLPLSVDELKEIIEQPAAGAGLEVEPELVSKIIDDVHQQPGALPLLQFALTELFEHQVKNTLALESYVDLGGVSGALAKRADDIFQELDDERQGIVRQLFLRLVTLGEGADDTRRRAAQSELLTLGDKPKTVQEVINLFSRYRLLTLDRDPETRAPTIEIAHEALIRQWYRLREWLDSGRDIVRLQRRLAVSTAEWRKSDDNSSFLASGARLAQFEGLLDSDDVSLNADEREYLAASVRLRQRSINRIKMFVAALVVVALFAMGMAVLALSGQRAAEKAQGVAEDERDRANEQASISLSQKLAVSALTDRDRLDMSFLLSVESNHIYDTLESRRSLLNKLSTYPRINTFLVGHDSGVRSVAFGPNGNIIATAGDDGTIIVWDAESYEQIQHLSNENVAGIRDITLNSDGTLLASAKDDGTIVIWDMNTYAILYTLEEHNGIVWQVAFDPVENRLSSVGDDGKVILWNLSSDEPISQLLADHEDAIYSVEISPNGQYLAAGGEDRMIRLWDLSTEDLDLTELDGHENWVMALAFSPNSNLLVSSGPEKEVFLWNVVEKTGLGKFPTAHTDWVRDIVFSPTEPLIAVASLDNTISLWDLTSIEQLGTPLVGGHTEAIWEITFTSDGQQLVSASLDGSTIIWDIRADHRLLTRLIEQSEPVLDVLPSSNGNLLAYAVGEAGSGNNSIIHLWDVQDAKELSVKLEGHVGIVASLAFHPDGSFLVSGGEDDSLILWDVDAGEILDQLIEHDSNVNAIAFSPNGELFASADESGTLLLWHKDVENDTWVSESQELSKGVRSVAFSPDGQILAAGDIGNNITLWRATNFEMIGEPLLAHSDVVASLDFSYDGSLLASGSHDNTIIIWDVAGQVPIGQPLEYHTNWVNSVVFHPNKLLLASGGSDNLVVLWDINRMQRIGTAFAEHDGWVTSLAFALDGSNLISAGQDGRVLMWDVDVDSWKSIACQIANRNLTQTEWNARIGNVDYHETCS